MPSHDWSRFHLRIPVQAGIAPLFDTWTSQAGLETWFLRKALFFRKDGSPKDAYARIEEGDTYQWWWHGYPDEVVEKGTIQKMNGKDSLQFTFGKAGKVKVTITKESATTLLDLEQFDIPADEEGRVNYHIGCTKGWLFYLTNLKSILEGGLDLRNKDVKLQEVVNA